VYPQYIDIINRILITKKRNLNAIKNYIEIKKQYVERLKASKLEKVPLDVINKYRLSIDSYLKNSYNILNLKIQKYKTNLVKLISKIDTLSPLKTLTRGYGVVENKDKRVIKSVNEVKKDELLDITLQDGKINVTVN